MKFPNEQQVTELVLVDGKLVNKLENKVVSNAGETTNQIRGNEARVDKDGKVTTKEA